MICKMRPEDIREARENEAPFTCWACEGEATEVCAMCGQGTDCDGCTDHDCHCGDGKTLEQMYAYNPC